MEIYADAELRKEQELRKAKIARRKAQFKVFFATPPLAILAVLFAAWVFAEGQWPGQLPLLNTI